MRFYAKTTDFLAVQILSKISAAMSKACSSSRIVFRVDPRDIKLILADRLVLGGMIMTSQIRGASLFDEYIVQSTVHNYISAEIPFELPFFAHDLYMEWIVRKELTKQ